MTVERRVGIVGYRSWIAEHLVGSLPIDVRVLSYEKSQLGTQDFSNLDCLYLVLGRAKPTEEEMDAEINQVRAFLANPHPRPRTVYLSSMMQNRAKATCEALIRADQVSSFERYGGITMIRPAAIFGPTQDIDSTMLIPSIVREGERLQINHPDYLTKFVSLDDLVGFLANFADPTWWNYNGTAEPYSIYDVPGTFTLTPNQVRDLWWTFEYLRKRNEARRPA